MGDAIRQKIKAFLADPSQRELRIKYTGPRMNAGYEWWRYRNPIRMLWTAFIVEVCRKLPPCEFKNNLYRMIGVKIGKDVTISPDVILDWLFPELITIDDGVLVGGDMIIATHEFIIDRIMLGRVRIGKQAMLASWVCVNPGVDIGERSIIGLFSYCRDDVPAYSFVAGIPAKVIKMLDKKAYLAEKKPHGEVSEVIMY